MKMEIKEEQFRELNNATHRKNAIIETVLSVVDKTEKELVEINELTDKVWDEIKSEHSLTDSVEWKIVYENGKPYVASVEEGK